MFRIQPNLPASAYQTYEINSPHDIFVKSACEQVSCASYRNGWVTTVNESTPLGSQQAEFIRKKSRRTFREQKTKNGLTIFTFDSGQRCFSNHRTRIESYSVLNGDWRSTRGVLRVHQNPADWVEDFGEHQLKIVEQTERG